MLVWYSTILSKYFGIDEPRIRTANKAAFVELLIATVATGTPRY